ncbi:MAG: RNA pseudouridine synthase, partial [Steroidobacteraceae bacterium]
VYGGRRRIPPASGPALIEALDSMRRQALHAARLQLEHPTTGRTLAWEAPVPADMSRLIKALEVDE